MTHKSLKYLLPGPLRKSLLTHAWEKNLFFRKKSFPGLSSPFFCLFSCLLLFFSFLLILPQFCSFYMSLFFLATKKTHYIATAHQIPSPETWATLASHPVRITHHSGQIEATLTSRVRIHEQLGIQSSNMMWPGPLLSFSFYHTPDSGFTSCLLLK